MVVADSSEEHLGFKSVLRREPTGRIPTVVDEIVKQASFSSRYVYLEDHWDEIGKEINSAIA